MKLIGFSMKCALFLFLTACSSDAAKSDDTSSTDSNIQEIQYSEISVNQEDIIWANQWDDFRFSIVNNDPEFDMLKHYNPDQISDLTANQLLEDEYTRETLENTSYEALEDSIFNGISAKAFYVIVASADIMVGTIYYFQSASYGLQLVGTMPY